MSKSYSIMLALLVLALPAAAQDVPCYLEGDVEAIVKPPPPPPDPFAERALRYAKLALQHRVKGLASYYSSFFDGRKTANGETFRNRRYSAAHLTLPLGCWVEVKARSTGKKLRLRVNDRGPYVKKFAIDLSQAAARYLGVDRTKDRYVEFRVIAMPGEEPLPEDYEGSVMQTTVPSPTVESTVSSPP
jgi:rare lipoprotein A (peptidoglycan hydrolase)